MSDVKLRMVKVVLHWVWDPIGIRGIAEAVDEYDSYAQPILELLELGSPADELASYLRRDSLPPIADVTPSVRTAAWTCSTYSRCPALNGSTTVLKPVTGEPQLGL